MFYIVRLYRLARKNDVEPTLVRIDSDGLSTGMGLTQAVRSKSGPAAVVQHTSSGSLAKVLSLILSGL